MLALPGPAEWEQKQKHCLDLPSGSRSGSVARTCQVGAEAEVLPGPTKWEQKQEHKGQRATGKALNTKLRNKGENIYQIRVDGSNRSEWPRESWLSDCHPPIMLHKEHMRVEKT